jgi:hypothetical protein
MSKFLLNLLLQISKALVNSKIQILFRKEFSFAFGPIGPVASRPACPLSPASHRTLPLSPAGHARALGPSRPARPWRICQKACLLRVCAARQRCLLPLSPPRGPHLSASSPPSRRPTRSEFLCAAAPLVPLPHASDAPEPLQPSLITLPLNPLQTKR